MASEPSAAFVYISLQGSDFFSTFLWWMPEEVSLHLAKLEGGLLLRLAGEAPAVQCAARLGGFCVSRAVLTRYSACFRV